MPFKGILSGLLTNQYVIVFRAPAARSYESVEGFRAPAGARNPSTLSRNRLACEPGEVKKQVVKTPGYPIVTRKAVYPGYVKRAMVLECRNSQEC